MRYLLVLGALIPICMPSDARADIYGFKIRVSVDKSGEVSRTDFSSYNAQMFADAEIAGCAAFGVTCTAEDVAVDMPRFRGLKSEDARSGNDHRGVYHSPPGFEICKVKVDWDRATIKNGPTFSATISRDRRDNGVKYSATVPDGAEIGVDLYIEFVPADTADQFECFPKNTSVLKCNQKDCPDKGAFETSRGIYPPARFP